MLRQLVLRLFPALAADMEAESRQWMLQCQRCGGETSVWDRGGIRYKALGRPRRYARCDQCQQRSWLKLYRQATQANHKE